MRARIGLVSIVLFSCGGGPSATPARPAPTSLTSADAGAVAAVSAACASAREARAKAAELAAGGHALLALERIDEANAACPAERASSRALEAGALAASGQCARVRALGGAAEAEAACAAIEAAPKGTAQTARAKMREAWAAERAKEWAKAKALWLDAWAEQHPSARALEAAARAATLAGDAAEGRRLRDRALVEAEAAENAVARLGERTRVWRGGVRMSGDVLTLGWEGKVVARDLASGDASVLLDVKGGGATLLSSYGTLALITPAMDPSSVWVYDLLTGALVFKAGNVGRVAAAPDDSRVAVQEQKSGDTVLVRVFDTATGKETAKLSRKWQGWQTSALAFAPDASHLVVYGDDADAVLRQYDLDKGAYTALRLRTDPGVAAASGDGRWLTWIEGSASERSPLHVRDMVENKEVAQWTSRFISVSALAIANDGKTLATGSYSSLRLWDVAEKKQLYKDETRGHGTDSSVQDNYAFGDDGKTLVFSGFGPATAWDIATGKQKVLVDDMPERTVLGVMRMPEDAGVAILLEDEVRVVPAAGEPRSVCRGMRPLYQPLIGPTAIAFSANGKSFACAMADGWVHLFDATTWTERAVIKKGPKASGANPVDLAYSADEKTLTIVTDTNVHTFDAQTAAQTSKVALRHPKVGTMARHARFADGTIGVRTWSNALAIFGADGAWQRDVLLAPNVPESAVDAFSTDGKAWAWAAQKTLSVLDLASNATRAVTLPQPAKALSFSADGKTLTVTGKDGAVYVVSGDEVRPIAKLSPAGRAWSTGAAVVAAGRDTIEIVAAGGAPLALEVDHSGLVVRDATGGFEARGAPELTCSVGKQWLTRTTCADRAKAGLVSRWLAATK